MKWEVTVSKNGENTLLLNGIQIYSQYRPVDGAIKFIQSEYDCNAGSYLLIGLGLGYHLKALLECVNGKKIIVYYFSESELQLFKKYNVTNWWEKENVHLVNKINSSVLENDLQIILPNVWLKAIGQEHPLFSILEVIKIQQISYSRSKDLLLENFNKNIMLNDFTIQTEKQSKVACLVAAGPSLNETVSWLKKYENDIDIYVVSAALKTLLANDIYPKAAVISDANEITVQHFEKTNFAGQLYYLSTANHQSVLCHKGPRFILYQKGYELAEQQAKKHPLIETGGSVGTVTFSLLERLGYEKVVLFGQDLGFYGQHTHANFSISNRLVTNEFSVREEHANDGSIIYTRPMFQVFKHWYDQKMTTTKVKVFNTATKGAKIKNVPLIDEQQFQHLVNGDNL